MANYRIRMSNDSLCHFGIKDMRWGHRNGPPYPLDYDSHSAAEKKHLQDRHKKTGISDAQKKAFKIGAEIVGVSLAAAGTAYMIKNGQLDSFASIGVNSIKSILSNDNIAKLSVNEIKQDLDFGSIDQTSNAIKSLFTDSPKAGTVKTEIDDFFDCNPGNNSGSNNKGLENNCIACALQNTLSKSGVYGYHARSSTQVDPKSGMVLKQQFDLNDVKAAFKGTKVDTIHEKDWGGIRSEINSFGEGAKGIIGNTRVKDGVPTRHAISFEVKNGKTIFADNQQANKMVDMLMEDAGLTRDAARAKVYSTFSDLSDNFLNNSSLFNRPEDTVRFIRLDTATAIDYDKLDKLLI